MVRRTAASPGPGGHIHGRMLRLVFHLVAAGALLAIPVRLSLGTPLQAPGTTRFVLITGGVAAYLLAACLLEVARWIRPHTPFFVAPAFGLLAYGLYAIVLLVAGGVYSRRVFAMSVVAGCVLLTFSFARRWLLGAGLVGAAAAIASLLFLPRATRPPANSDVASLTTAYEWLDVLPYPGRLPEAKATGGALAPLDDSYLLAMGDGRLFLLRFHPDTDSLDVESLATKVPINADEFAAGAGERQRRDWFRVADILVRKTPQGIRLLASHHYWRTSDSCFVVRVSKLETTIDRLRGEGTTDAWSTIFETTPCMPVGSMGFIGLEVGGSMVALDDSRILLALGHHGFDGVDSSLIVSQDPTNDLGKTILIDLPSGRARHYTLGHRNPQGLSVASDGSVWLTEHGPQGGDELNLIVDSANYGWPYETYGTQYGTRTWPLSATPGEHEKYRAPIFAWVPSIGVSSVFQSTGRAVPAWRGDLLIGSLGGRSLWRVRVRHGRAVFTERIPLGRRIRDAVEGNDGRIVIWANENEIVSLRPSRLGGRGEQLFAQCAGCHALGDGRTNGIGPDLHGIMERRIASVPGFQYSPALRKLQGAWEWERLAAFLRHPEAFAPGTSMQFKGIPDSLSRVALLQYLSGK